MAFNNSLKKILGCPTYVSSHLVAEICNTLLLKHKVCFIQGKYFKNILNSDSQLILINRFFIKHGLIGNHVINNFKDFYQINILNFDIKTIFSRISWVQNHE